MNILIIENEVYLAQKVVSRLLDDGHNCDFVENVNLENLTKEYDIVLLSTSISSSIVKGVIKKYGQNSIILLLVSYISDETVTNPIKDGAKDYIMKPFLMDELVRKIYHYKECRAIRRELKVLKDYFEFTMSDIDIKDVLVPFSFPLLIETNFQSYADKLVFEIAKKVDLPIKFISLSSANWQKQITNQFERTIIYLTDYHTLKRNVKDQLIKQILDKKCVICSLESDDEFTHKKVVFNSKNKSLDHSQIMSINDYIKTIVINHQNRYPDTELSKRLGISRKSLWEKRKKLEIDKKK
ncbi:response regulator transcription factor [Aliarcobacter cryaerophilus]|jgi:DNA-binding NtrC family response regulator|uniref:Response regulator transcription factor n=4 Tax=Arcobacteraceae TaxID=2808963 RepID=A0AA96DQJ8_9BACT|nr:response regulator transcription factor [Aliarcobacter cryaerophilus]OQA74955.1 MAG: acetoacetate metabolism regulatory protein AtoC [Candidatus Dependentiae bacterium ADurb.Bin246]WNL12320.1 response regulator transcription factor [Arcobacter sp. AZ-2023]WPD08809.1 response regulator transcription factor [Arcobacter sp. DSM 115954]WPD12940.1 response regulator transcription factor [Arcobacter sp. DSM 115960]MCT7444389.1 response regulator transcription factor [Aliarcobacter cryaerophilus]